MFHGSTFNILRGALANSVKEISKYAAKEKECRAEGLLISASYHRAAKMIYLRSARTHHKYLRELTAKGMM